MTHTATCLNCPKVFRTLRSALKALNEGCPRCGESEIDLETEGLRIEVGSLDLNYLHHPVVVGYPPSHYNPIEGGAM